MAETPTPEDTRAALQAERAARVAACQEAIRQALAVQRCALVAQAYIDQQGRIRARVTIAPQD